MAAVLATEDAAPTVRQCSADWHEGPAHGALDEFFHRSSIATSSAYAAQYLAGLPQTIARAHQPTSQVKRGRYRGDHLSDDPI